MSRRTYEAEICDSAGNHDLSNQPTASVPHINTIITAGVDIAVEIAFDAIRNATICHGEYSSIGKELTAMPFNDIKSVAARWSAAEG